MRYLPNGRAVKVADRRAEKRPPRNRVSRWMSVMVQRCGCSGCIGCHKTSVTESVASGNPLQVHPVRWLSPVNDPDLDVAVGWPPASMRTVQWEPDQSSPIRAVTAKPRNKPKGTR